MVERINLLLKAKNITARQFAEEIGIQPSGMSHILSGRNNPSLDFVMKVVKRWPEININWLMFGKGEMFDGLSNHASNSSHPTESEPVIERTQEPVTESVPDVKETSSEVTNTQPVQEYDLFSQPVSEPVRPAPKQQSNDVSSVSPVSPQAPQLNSSPTGVPSTASIPADVSATTPSPSVPREPNPSVVITEHSNASPAVSSSPQSIPNTPSQTQPHENRPDESVRPAGLLQPNLANKQIVKVIILYDDHSFAEYSPE